MTYCILIQCCRVHGFHKMRTALRFEIANGKPQKYGIDRIRFKGKL